MPRIRSSLRSVVFATGLAATVARAADVETTPPHVTIRGGGSAGVSIDRGTRDASTLLLGRSPSAPDVLAEAARLAARGDADASVIAYLRAHRADLPAVVDLDSLRRLERAGAGDAVISYLSSVSALDIGITGHSDRAPAPVVIESQAGSFEPYGDLYDGAYYGGGYAGAYWGGNGWKRVTHFPHFGFRGRSPLLPPRFPKQLPAAPHRGPVGTPHRMGM